MWLVESGIANLLSVPHLEADGFKVKYTDDLWTTTTPEGHVIPFKKDTCKCRGFPYIEMGSLTALALLQSMAKVETVRGNYEGLTKWDVKKAVLARKTQTMVGRPSKRQSADLVSDSSCNALKTIPVSYSDLTKTQTVFGPNLSEVRRKTVRQKPDRGRNGRNTNPSVILWLA